MKSVIRLLVMLFFAWIVASCTKENDPGNGGNSPGQYSYSFGYYHPAKKVYKVNGSFGELEFVWDGDDLAAIIGCDFFANCRFEYNSEGRISRIWDSTFMYYDGSYPTYTLHYDDDTIIVQDMGFYKIVGNDVYYKDWFDFTPSLIGHIDDEFGENIDQANNPFKDLLWAECMYNNDVRFSDVRYNHGSWAHHNLTVSRNGRARYRYEYDDDNYPISCWKTDPDEYGDSQERLAYSITYFPMGGVDVSGSYNGHDYVDLGLPSGTLWATCNVGADNPETIGDYFAWGETQSKSRYYWDTYMYGNDDNQLTKYCNNSMYGYNGFTDNLTTLQASDDAATANWGDFWRTPTKEEWEELLEYTTILWVTTNIHDNDYEEGFYIAGLNGNSIFLPIVCHSFSLGNAHSYMCPDYWSSSCHSYQSCYAYCFNGYEVAEIRDADRCMGLAVRPVYTAY